MPSFTTPMSKLEAVNICLSSMGEPPVNTLDGAGIDAQMALELIAEVSRSVQLVGWHWNRENFSISPDVNGNINLPENTLKIDSTSYDASLDVVQRGRKLYNRTDNTFTFTNPVLVEVILLLDFDDIPEAAKQFITYTAALTLQERILGSDTLDKFLRQRLASAQIEMMRDANKAADPNMLRDNWSTLGTVQRGWFRRGAFQSGVY